MGPPSWWSSTQPPPEPEIRHFPIPDRTPDEPGNRPRAWTAALFASLGVLAVGPVPAWGGQNVQPQEPAGAPTAQPEEGPPIPFAALPPGPARDAQIFGWSSLWSRDGAAEIGRLLEIAADEDESLEIRAAAILASGRHGSLAAAESLFELARSSESDPVLAASAYEALSIISGRPDLGRDPEAWAGWLAEARGWNTEQWDWVRIERIRWAAENAQATANEAERVAAETARRLFVGSSNDRRPGLLAELLNSPLPRVYSLGLDLAARELAEARPIGEGAAKVAIARLQIAAPEERARLVALLDASGRPDAIEALRTRLADETERVVCEPLLRAAARRPASVTVGPSIRWLERTRGDLDAASVSITAHVRAGLLGDPDLERVRAVLARLGSDAMTAELAGLTVLTAPAPWLESVHPLLRHEEIAVRDTAALLVADRLIAEDRAAELEVLAAEEGLAEDVVVRLNAALPEDVAPHPVQEPEPEAEQPASQEHDNPGI